MDDNQGMIGMGLGSWLIGAAVGALGAIMLWVLGGWSFMQGAFAGVVIALLVGAVIAYVMTRPLTPPTSGATAAAPETKAMPAPETKAAPAAPAPEAPAAAAPAAAEAAPKVTPSAPLPGQAELAERKGEWSYGEDKPAASEDRPAALTDAPKDGQADDLKLIGGVGPKLEQTLNDLGVWHFEQIANFTKEDIAWVDERLRFKGRIERDDWMGQAKILAAGGETEFSKKKKS